MVNSFYLDFGCGVLILTGIILVFWFYFVKVKKNVPPNEIECFFAKYLNELSEEETTAKINEIADINSQYPIDDKKIAQALLRFYYQLNTSDS